MSESSAMLEPRPGKNRAEQNSDDVLHVAFTDHSFVVYLADGCVLSVPLAWYPLLNDATPAARSNWVVADGGRAIRWPQIGQHFSVSGLLDGDTGPHSAA